MSKTIFVFAPAAAHTQAHHPESFARLNGMMQALDRFGVLPDLTAVDPVPATVAQLRRVHTSGLIEHIRRVSLRGGGLLDHGDTYATRESYDLARTAAGGCCRAIDAIMVGEAQNGIALVRPPGHHAETNRVSGFCLFNNIAVAARHAQAVHGVERVLIIDFDVHHGNGTQEIFYHDDTVLFVSLHLYAPFFYPGIGGLNEIGSGQGRGFTLNVPFPPRVGDHGYLQVLEEIVRPKAAAFQPELILVSAGFDAHWQDPLAMAGLSLTGYAQLARSLVEMAEQQCQGRILFVLEGGYQLEALTYGIVNLIHALTGGDEVYDPLGAMPQTERDVTDLLAQLKRLHLLK